MKISLALEIQEGCQGTLVGVREDVGMQDVGGAIRIALLYNARYIDFVRPETFRLVWIDSRLTFITTPKKYRGEVHR